MANEEHLKILRIKTIMTNSVGDKLRAYWRSNGLAVPKGITETGIREFESRYKVRLPVDFRDYFLRINGMKTHWRNAQDPEGYAFWPLERVKTVSEEAAKHQHSEEWSNFLEADSLFIFADYLGWSWAYAIRLNRDPLESTPVYIIGKNPLPIRVADSYLGFIELYLVDSPILYGVFDAWGDASSI
jgi:hypothetical protein